MKPCKAILQGVSLKPNKILTPCCQFKPSSDWASQLSILEISSLEDYKSHKLVLQLNEDLNNGIEDPQCRTCWAAEKEGSHSWRQTNNEQIKHDSYAVDISLGSACNLKCIMCVPSASSQIEAEYKKAYKETKNPFFMFDGSKNKTDEEFKKWILDLTNRATSLTIFGGEPFYNKALPEMLAIANANNVEEVDLITNGTTIGWDLIKPLKHALISFSIDAVDAASEYVRYGSKWEEVRSNYLQCKVLPNITTNVILTITMFNVFDLANVALFFKDNYPNHLHLNPADPNHFNAIENLPPDLVQEAKGIFEEFLRILNSNEKIDYWERRYLEDTVVNCISRLGTKYTPEKFSQFIDYTKTIDKLRGHVLTDYFAQFKTHYGI